MNGRIILMAVLALGLLQLVTAWPMVVRRFLRRSEDRNAGKSAQNALEFGSPAGVLEEVDTRIAEQQEIVDKFTTADAAAYTAGPGGPLDEARRELRELKKYRERLIHEARERGLDIPD